MRQTVDYTVYQTYSTTDQCWWTVYQFYINGEWDEDKSTLEDGLSKYPKATYDWNLISDGDCSEDIFKELIRIRDEHDWAGVDQLLRDYGRGYE